MKSKLALIYTLYVFTLMLGYASTSLANPVINNVEISTELNQITITGQNFGSRNDYSPNNNKMLSRAWNNFENGSILVDDWKYGLSGAYSENWKLDSGNRNRNNSKYFAARNYISSRLGGLEITQQGDQNEWYWTFYIQISDTCPTSGGQGKLSRIYGDNGNIYFAPYSTNNQIYTFFESIGKAQWGTTTSIGTNVWHRVEIYMRQSPQTTNLYMDGKLQWSRTDWPSANFNGGGHSWDIGNMVESVANSCYHRFDDIYFDHTQARIEIGNNIEWDKSTVKEIQIPIEWTGGNRVKVNANYGSFNVNGPAYLFVVGADGSVSAGHQIIVGQAISTVESPIQDDSNLVKPTIKGINPIPK